MEGRVEALEECKDWYENGRKGMPPWLVAGIGLAQYMDENWGMTNPVAIEKTRRLVERGVDITVSEDSLTMRNRNELKNI